MVELGQFIDQPVQTYSLGMRARLEFAVATAINPDILIIDELLGAGDGYFVSKCRARMNNLVNDTQRYFGFAFNRPNTRIL